jgi:threonylcarbamoyladenosine tRNA methylthiotransferase MtaB
MGRRYTTTDIRRVVSALRQSLDRPALTTDIIVGFPGETDDEFAQTLDLARDIGFAKIHVFAFSPRIGTAAARMTNQVHNPTIKNRSERLRTLNRELGQAYRNQFLGQTAQVLIESDGRIPAGYSERYFKVYLSDASPNPRKNDLLTVRLQDHYRDGLKAIPIREPLPNV